LEKEVTLFQRATALIHHNAKTEQQQGIRIQGISVTAMDTPLTTGPRETDAYGKTLREILDEHKFIESIQHTNATLSSGEWLVVTQIEHDRQTEVWLDAFLPHIFLWNREKLETHAIEGVQCKRNRQTAASGLVANASSYLSTMIPEIDMSKLDSTFMKPSKRRKPRHPPPLSCQAVQTSQYSPRRESETLQDMPRRKTGNPSG
jgi:hypothetical protein